MTLNQENCSNTAILLMHCPDQPGIVAKITEFLFENSGNVIYLDQHVDHQEKVFFMRIEWELENFVIPQDKIAEYFSTLIASRYHMTWNIYFSQDVPRMAIFVSKMSHCLFDILSRYQSGEWNVKIPLIISNHPDLAPVIKRFGFDFRLFPINENTKLQQESLELTILKEKEIDFVVLARYMQVLSDEFIGMYPDKIINIHHSFLPAFPGAKPYHSAYERGVKIIGATSHYVTADLDAGPIIEQDVARISHTDTIKNLIRKGQDLEKIILSRAVYAHLQHKILVYKNRTIVFS
jgi:formyltetrahydrofolate deformylase